MDSDFLLLNADAVFDVDFNRFVAFHKRHGGLVTLFTHPNSCLLYTSFSLLTPRVYYVGIGLIVSSCVILLINIGLTARLTPDLKVQRGYFSIEAVKSILSAGIWSSVNSLGNTLNTGLDLLVSNMMLSALAAGQLAIVKTISTIFTTLFQLVATAFQPMQLKYYANNDKKLLISSFKLGIKLNGMISNIAFAGFTVFGAVYYKLWTPRCV